MKSRVLRKISGFLVICSFFSITVSAQTRNDVVNAYNEGAKAAQTDVPAAIAAFEQVVSLSDKVGETASDLKQKAVQVLPSLYLKQASDKISQKKPADEILKAAKDAVNAANKYGNDAQKESAKKVLVSAYNSMATSYFSKNELDKALVTFDSVLAINPGYVAAMYNKALIFRKQNNSDSLEQTIDSYLSKLGPNDAEKSKQASAMALEYFRGLGSKANQDEKLDDAMNLLNKAAKYGEDKDLFYYFADVYNKQKNFDQGAQYAQKGLALETGAAEAKAKFYYQLAVAQAGKGQNAEACESFKNAMYGPFEAASKAQRTNLKCQ